MAEFPNLGKHCSLVDCKQLDFLPFTCDGCGKTFCSDHKFQDHHQCDKSCVETAGGDYDGVRSYSCDVTDCNKRELMPVVCEKCHKNFCLSHRHQQEHMCEKLEVKEELTKTAEHVKKILASKTAKTPVSKSNRGKSSKTAAKVALMKMKMKAVGDQAIPEADRVFMLVCLPSDHKDKTKAMFFSKDMIRILKNKGVSTYSRLHGIILQLWTVGRVIDNIADHNKITNSNNKGGPKKLHLFLHDCGSSLETEKALESLMNEDMLYNGGTVILENVDTDCTQLENFSDYVL